MNIVVFSLWILISLAGDVITGKTQVSNYFIVPTPRSMPLCVGPFYH